MNGKKKVLETLVTIKVSIVLLPFMEPKERILKKAEELFMQFGIRSVSMDDIATQVGMSKKTIYHYFVDKDELVDAVIDTNITCMQHDCTHCKSDAKDAVHEMFITMERVIEQFSNMNPMLLYDLEKFHFKSYQRFVDHKNTFMMKMIVKNIKWGIQEELYRPEINIEILAKFRLESMMISYNMHVFPPSRFPLIEVTKEIIHHYLYGLASIKGHKLIQKYNQQAQKAKLNKL
jgi:TetR/AcrR family transcriptional regulator, cholesterol catabolism regulator